MCANQVYNLNDTLQKYYGHSEFRPLQRDIIEHVIDGNDSLALLPTSGGKSICYQIPGFLMEGMCIVISPLVSLMRDQVDALNKRGFRANMIIGDSSESEKNAIIIDAMNKKLDFLYISPERLQTQSLRNIITNVKISLFAIDEAHCVSTWGHGFRPDYAILSSIMDLSPETPRLAVTATANDQTQQDIIKLLGLEANCKIFQSSFQRNNITINVTEVDTQKEIDELILKTVKENINSKGIVYCLTRRECQFVCEMLDKDGIPNHIYHGGMSRAEREYAQKRFEMMSASVMVATMGFGMGIDIPDIRYVLHDGLPGTAEAFYQEIGRAGRDGKDSFSHAFHRAGSGEWIRTQCSIRDNSYENALLYSQAVMGNICRNKGLLKCLGEDIEDCGKCDICCNKMMMISHEKAIDITKKILRQIIHFSQDRTMPSYDDLFGGRYPTRHYMDQLFMQGLIDYDTSYCQSSAYVVLTGKGIDWISNPKPVRMNSNNRAVIYEKRNYESLTYTQKERVADMRALRCRIASEISCDEIDILTDDAILELSCNTSSRKECIHYYNGVSVPEEYYDELYRIIRNGRDKTLFRFTEKEDDEMSIFRD